MSGPRDGDLTGRRKRGHSRPRIRWIMQTRTAHLAQITLYSLASALAAALIAFVAALLAYQQLTPHVLGTALGWGSLSLIFLAGAVVLSQGSLGQGEAPLRAHLGQGSRPRPLPLAQILSPLTGAGLLFLVQVLILTDGTDAPPKQRARPLVP